MVNNPAPGFTPACPTIILRVCALLFSGNKNAVAANQSSIKSGFFANLILPPRATDNCYSGGVAKDLEFPLLLNEMLRWRSGGYFISHFSSERLQLFWRFPFFQSPLKSLE